MKKITLIGAMLVSSLIIAQQKSTGSITLSTNMSASLTLDNTTSMAVLSLTGPNDRWFALQFGSFATGDGMLSGEDVVYWNNTALIDAKMNGVGVAPSSDITNNWTLVSNVNNTPSTGLRTIVYTRPLNTGDTNDYVFNYADTSIDFAWARRSSAGFSLNNHSSSNRGYVLDVPLSVLGSENFSLESALIYPNPAKDIIYVKTTSSIESINLYNQIGTFVKTMKFDSTNENEIDIRDLSTGVYFLEIKSNSERTWKKIIIE